MIRRMRVLYVSPHVIALDRAIEAAEDRRWISWRGAQPSTLRSVRLLTEQAGDPITARTDL